MGVVSNNWFDGGFLSNLYMFRPSRRPMFKPPFLGTPLVPLRAKTSALTEPWPGLRPFLILRIVRPRIFESKFRNHCAKKLVGALRKPASFM